jgi:predicted SprT family Zn-dependent metalloprotease
MNKNADTMLNDALDIMQDLNIEVGKILGICWNPRLKAVWGRCVKTSYGYYKIELNTILNNDAMSWDEAMSTVIHEVLHCHKDRFCHTGEWKRCAELVNYNYPHYNIKRASSPEEKGVAEVIANSYKYTVKCVSCGYTTKLKRECKMIKSIRRNEYRYRCSCGSMNLKVFEN